MNLIKKLFQFSIGSVAALFIGLISIPIITRTISPEQYGKGTMFITVASLLSVVMLMGYEQSFVKFFYKEEEVARPTLLIKCLKIPVIVTILIFVSTYPFRNYIERFLFGEVGGNLYLLTIVYAFILSINNFSLLVIRMQQKGITYSILTTLLKINYLIFILLGAKIFDANFKTIVYATISSYLIVTIIAIIIEKKYWLNKVGCEIKTTNKEIFQFAWPLAFMMMVNWLFQSIDKFAINIFYDYKELGIYSQASTLVGMIAVIQSAFTTFWTPIAYEKYEKNPEDTNFYKKIFKYVSFIMFSIAIIILLLKDLLIILLGDQYRNSIFILPFLLFMPIMYTISEVSQVGINFKGKSKKHLVIAIISCLSNLILALIMVPNLGAKGAAISTGIAYIVFFIMRTYYSEKYYKIGFNYKNLGIMVSVLVTYSFIATFYRFSMLYLFLGLISLGIIMFINRDLIKDIILKIKMLKKEKSL